MLAVIGLALWARGEAPKTADTAQPSAPQALPVEAKPAIPARPATNRVAPGDELAGFAKTDSAQRQALEGLELLLSEARLWSNVRVAGGVVEVTSGACSREEMRPTLEAAAADLQGKHLTAIRCLAQHGGIIFEFPL